MPSGDVAGESHADGFLEKQALATSLSHFHPHQLHKHRPSRAPQPPVSSWDRRTPQSRAATHLHASRRQRETDLTAVGSTPTTDRTWVVPSVYAHPRRFGHPPPPSAAGGGAAGGGHRCHRSGGTGGTGGGTGRVRRRPVRAAEAPGTPTTGWRPSAALLAACVVSAKAGGTEGPVALPVLCGGCRELRRQLSPPPPQGGGRRQPRRWRAASPPERGRVGDRRWRLQSAAAAADCGGSICRPGTK